MTESNGSAELKLRREGLAWEAVEDEVVALDVRHSLYLATNRAGAVLWALLAEGTTRELLVASLRERFDISREVAIADVDRFVTVLSNRGLLEW